MKRLIPVLAACMAWSGSSMAAHGDIEQAGTALKYAIPAAALLSTFLTSPDDAAAPPGQDPGVLRMGGTPRHDLLLALGRAWVVTAGLKQAVNEKRPDGGQHSFPSGHTSMAFSGAEFIRKEYGWQWATPAYLAAGFVGWSRVKADRHYTHDVLAGAAIGILANHDFWEGRTRAGQLRLSPTLLYSGRQTLPAIGFQLAR